MTADTTSTHKTESATGSASPEAAGLQTALRAEHAAIFAYGVVAAYSRPDRQDMIATAVAAHRARRDALITALGAANVTAPEAEAGYAAPFPVTDPASAARLAAQVENDTAVAWRAALEQASSETTRHSCVDNLTDCATRLAQWRDLLGITPPTTAFPGKG
jgi:aspartate/methionine/tyrosine aminotransferase